MLQFRGFRAEAPGFRSSRHCCSGRLGVLEVGVARLQARGVQGIITLSPSVLSPTWTLKNLPF